MPGQNPFTVNFYSKLREISGQKSVEFSLSGKTTVQSLVEAVVLRYPQMKDLLLQEDGTLNNKAHFYVNGRDMPFLANAQYTVVSRQDKFDFFPPGHF